MFNQPHTIYFFTFILYAVAEGEMDFFYGSLFCVHLLLRLVMFNPRQIFIGNCTSKKPSYDICRILKQKSLA